MDKEAVVGCTATADRSVSTQHVADSKESAEGLYTVDVKITNRTRRNRDELTRLIRFATPADFPLRECTAYIGLHVRRESAGGVPRSMENAPPRLVLMDRAVHTPDWVWPWRQLETACPLDRANIW